MRCRTRRLQTNSNYLHLNITFDLRDKHNNDSVLDELDMIQHSPVIILRPFVVG